MYCSFRVSRIGPLAGTGDTSPPGPSVAPHDLQMGAADCTSPHLEHFAPAVTDPPSFKSFRYQLKLKQKERRPPEPCFARDGAAMIMPELVPPSPILRGLR